MNGALSEEKVSDMELARRRACGPHHSESLEPEVAFATKVIRGLGIMNDNHVLNTYTETPIRIIAGFC
jgi:hypothetical protein